MDVFVSNGNNKMGSIASVSLPTCVCNPNLPCYKSCYARRMEQRYKATKATYDNNLAIWNESPKAFEDSLLKQLPFMGVFRWFVSGDILNEEFLEMMVRVAKKVKGVKFLAFTKKYSIVNTYLNGGKKLPSNLRIVFSGWKGLDMDNPYSLPVAWMYDKNNIDERIPKSAIICGGHCTECGMCWNLRKKQNIYFNKH